VLPNHKLLLKNGDYESDIGMLDLDTLKFEQTGLVNYVFNNFIMLENGLVVCSETSRIVGSFTHHDIVYLRVQNFVLQPVHRIRNGHSNLITCLQALPNSEMASGAADNKIKIWSSNYQLLRTLEGHRDSLSYVKYIGNNSILSLADDKAMHLWNYQSGECLKVIEIEINNIADLIVSMSEGFFVILSKAMYFQELSIYEMHNYQCVLKMDHRFFEGFIKAIDYLGDKRFVVATSKQIAIFDFQGETKNRGIAL
jgi:WD40 repeat protein